MRGDAGDGCGCGFFKNSPLTKNVSWVSSVLEMGETWGKRNVS